MAQYEVLKKGKHMYSQNFATHYQTNDGSIKITLWFFSYKASGEKKVDLFNKEDTPGHVEEEETKIVIDGEQYENALGKNSDSVLDQLRKVPNAVILDKDVDEAQLNGDINTAKPMDLLKVN